MKIVKTGSEQEQLLRKLEDFLQENLMTIQVYNGGLAISYDGVVFKLQDVDDGQICFDLPRMLDSERLVLVEW